jgi:hypothetical protein
MAYWFDITDYAETRETLGVEGDGEYGLVFYVAKDGDIRSMSILLVL